MKIKKVHIFSFLLIFIFFPVHTLSLDRLHTDTRFSIAIAVTINQNDNIVGSFEYSNHKPQYPIQLVSFTRIGDNIYSNPYVYEIIEKQIILPYLHKIKCRVLNDKYDLGELILGTIDFRDESKPKINLVTDSGYVKITNISERGKKFHSKYFQNIWLGH
jgi:hypothetical protein